MVARPAFIIDEEQQAVQSVQGDVRELRQSIGETWLLCAPPLPPSFPFQCWGWRQSYACWAGALLLDYTPAPARLLVYG